MQVSAETLKEWSAFYEIVGSAAGALTGLQFVVIALISQARVTGSMLEIRAFGSPNVVHFCAALLISAMMSAPWDSLSHAAVALGAIGIAGVLYSSSVIRHARKQTGYKPDAEDWFWYVILPLSSYVALLVSAMFIGRGSTLSLCGVASVAVTLLLLSIHNAWDAITYIAITHTRRRDSERPPNGV